MQNKCQCLCVLLESVGKCQFALQSFALWWNYNSCSVGDDASAFACAPPQSQRSPLHECTQKNVWTSFKHLLLLELPLREWTLNEHDRCCLSAVMVVFQCAADHNLRWVIPQTSCQHLLPSASCVPHNIWQSNGQMGPVSFDLRRWERMLSDESTAGYWSLPLAPRFYSAEKTRLKAPFSLWYGCGPVASIWGRFCEELLHSATKPKIKAKCLFNQMK